MTNYFETGLGLIEHLRTKADEWGVKHVGTVADINSINRNITPALYVINTSNNPAETIGGHASQDAQQWTIVVAVSNQAAQKDTDALMRAAGELIGNVINHVQGYAVDDYHDPLKRVGTSGTPKYFTAFALYPFTFATKFEP